MKVMVTGGAGFIGSHIVDLLIQEGHRVVVVDNLVTGKKSNVNPKAVFYEVDILEKQLEQVVAQESPEVIIHQAALVFVQQSIKDPLSDGRVNALGTLNVLRSAYLHKVRKIIYASTCAVYGESQSMVINEEHPVFPLSFYGASKHMGEIYIRLVHELYKLEFTILRYANVYGPRQCQHGEGGVIPIFAQSMKRGILPTIFGDGMQTRDFIYVKDVAKANVLALHKGSQQTLNIGTGVGTTINDLQHELAQIMKFKGQAQHTAERLGDVKHCCLDPQKAKRELGWTANFSLSSGLKETVSSFAAKGSDFAN